MRISKATLSALAILLMAGVTGCPSPNTYGTARTTPKGKISHSFAAEGYGVSYSKPKDEDGVVEDGSVFVPTFPSYTLRYGVSDSIDIGGRIANLSSLGADAKINFLKGDSLDLAIDPGLQYMRITTSSSAKNPDGTTSTKEDSISMSYLHLPLLIDLNVSESFSVIATPGVMYGLVTGDSNGETFFHRSGIVARLGVGFNVRFSKKFALQPEITFLKGFDDEGTLVYSAGVGFNFGSLPKFGSSASGTSGQL